ncbi:unnamed protein product [Caenorhabditis sp. 36 PRJEB53466]|nr:unnamed protein product [Caenorhabditis sp. 36 PRJEB53466]
MVKRLIVQGLGPFTTENTLRKHFEQFGELYECQIPPPPRYSVIDNGPDDEDVEARSSIRWERVDDTEDLDDELSVEPFDEEVHETFEKYMRKIGSGDGFHKNPRKTCAGYAYITFLDMNGYLRCVKEDVHEVGSLKCTVEPVRSEEEEEEQKLKIESKRLFVSFFPLDRLSAKELKNTFGAYGKITDVEFVSDSEGPLHFCIITFHESSSVDVILTKTIFIRDVRMFTRRAVLKESIKIAEHKRKEAEKELRIQLPPNHTAYPRPRPTFPRISAQEAVAQASSLAQFDPSAAAGYAPMHRPSTSSSSSSVLQPENDLLANYGYGPRKW